jgi:hypothetical protein
MYNELRPPTTKKIKLAIYPDVEKAMEMWFKEVKKNKDVTLDGPLMQQQALKFAQYFNNKEFKASNGWLELKNLFSSESQQLFRLSRWYNEDGKFYSK